MTTIRLSPEANRLLELLAKEGGYRSKTDVVQTALNILNTIQQEKRRGRRVVSMPEAAIQEQDIPVQIA